MALLEPNTPEHNEYLKESAPGNPLAPQGLGIVSSPSRQEIEKERYKTAMMKKQEKAGEIKEKEFKELQPPPVPTLPEEDVENNIQEGRRWLIDHSPKNPLQPREGSLPASIDMATLPGKHELSGTSILNFLFGSEMAILGIKLDNEGFHHDWEIAKQQWSEEPLWLNLLTAGSLFGTALFPFAKAASTSMKVGLLGQKLGKFGTRAEEILKFKGLGFIDEGVKDVSNAELKKLRILENAKGKYETLMSNIDKANRGELKLPLMQRLKFEFDQRFSNTYFKISRSIAEGTDLRTDYAKRLQDLWAAENLGRYFAALPEPEAGPRIYQHWLSKINPDIPAPKLSAQDRKWADMLGEAMRKHQQEAFDEAFITRETLDKVGEMHVPAQYVGTPVPTVESTRTMYIPLRGRPVRTRKVLTADEELVEGILGKKRKVSISAEPGEEYIALRTYRIPRLDSETLRVRKADTPEVYRRLINDELITDPADLTMNGYVMDRLLLNNYRFMRDIAMDDRYAVRASDIIRQYGDEATAEAKGWVRIDGKVPKSISSRLSRMMVAKGANNVGADGALPFIRKQIFDELFSEEGMFAQTQAATDFLELMTTIHKSSKCIVAGSRILTDHGYLKIEDAYEYKLGFNENISPYAPKVWSPILNGWEKLKASYYSDGGECIKITLRDGTELEGTLDHPVMSNGEWVKFKDIKVGDIVDEYLGGEFPKEYVEISINPWNNTRINNNLNYGFEGNASFEFDDIYAELIGWLIGDGNIRHEYAKITVGGQDYDYSISRLKYLCKEKGLNFSIQKDGRKDRDIWYFVISNKKFVEFLESIGVTTNTKTNKKKKLCVPELIFRSPKSVVCAFIRGLMDTDGSASSNGSIQISSISEQLMRDTQILLKWLGIPCSLRSWTGDINLKIGPTEKTYKNHTHWQLRLSSRQKVHELKLFGMPRKLNNIPETPNRKPWINRVKSIERTGIKPVYDVSLDDPHAFIGHNVVYGNTALAPTTHFQNFAGNMVMLSQAGFNPLDPENIRIQQKMAESFTRIANLHQAAREAGASTRKILDTARINLGTIKIGKKTFNLNDELLDPMVRELIEESAFETTEGFSHLQRITERLRDDQKLTKAVAKGFMKSKKIFQLGDKEGFRWFDKMTRWYLGEDMVPKMAYYMSLRSKGLSKQAAVLEVGRRLPMYSTVGATIKRGRKVAFPWASFPTEAMRITKNNMMDHPIRMLPWLHLPGIVQGALSAVGGAPEDIAEVEEAKKGLPFFAYTPTTVIGSGRTTALVGGGATGALTGGVAGGLKGGPVGAAIGAAAGGLIGAAGADYLTTNEHAEHLRGMVMDWLPHTSFMLTSVSPEFGTDTSPWQNMADLQQQIPAEPFAIMKPMLEIMAGRTSWGTDIGAEDVGDEIGKTIAGYIGFLSPPLIQKYGFTVTPPDVSVTEATFGEPVFGDFTNIYRGLVDTGEAIDVNTGKPGSLSHDYLIKNFGIGKSWLVNPDVQLANESKIEYHAQAVRDYLSRNFSYHLQEGKDNEAKMILTKVMSTFSRQYADDPRQAQSKFSEWLSTKLDAIGRHPRLRNWSEEDILRRLKEATQMSADMRYQVRHDLISALRSQLKIRQIDEGEDVLEKAKNRIFKYEKDLYGKRARGFLKTPLYSE